MITADFNLPDLLGGHGGVALTAPGRTALSYGGLASLIGQTGRTLAARAVGPGAAVAIVLPNGPEMAAVFLGVAAHCVAAPLNPNYTSNEFGFYLQDLNARLLIVMAGDDTPARAAAVELAVPVAEITPGTAAGAFEFPDAGGADARLNGPDDTAVVLHTSGTTSRPKIVPLTLRNIATSASSIAATLQLTPRDKCLNIMPLFHIHGLIAAVLSTLHAGASITCTPGFDALRFYGWLRDENPSWYSAVPTMHQAILARAKRNTDIIAAAKLRFIRSSSASLPVPVLEALEATFGCPVIESYGMTEAAHQMTSNQLPPGMRKPGSVGVAAGPQVAIMGDGGAILPQGAIGEIVIRGGNVTPGYQSNPKANAENWTGGWFRTGDQGVLDGDGFLRINGRLKEIINRGGEKISPREVDDVLIKHPAVSQVVCFAMPHRMLGEAVAAAVVLEDGQTTDDKALKAFASEQLAAFKVPSKFVFLDEIPKGATGKLQRIGLAEKLGLTP